VLVVAVVGPTATGKSDLGVDLALALGGEVVNADAFQLYRGMDVGTAKLPVAERRGVPHHLLDVLDVRADATVALYQGLVQTAVADVLARGALPVVVGGSGLYVRAALDVLTIPPTDPVARARLEADLADAGSLVLHARLAQVDPVAAQRIDPLNSRRVVRALEVVELTGQPFSATMPEQRYRRPSVQLGLRVPRPELDQRIQARVQRMWADGLPAEARALDEQGLRQGRTASRAVGYGQALAELDGELDAAQAQESTAAGTRRLVRRQESWLGRDERIAWLDASTSARATLLERALAVVRAAGSTDAR
jgi:tRNA dimethylallyltransferase